MPAKLSSPMARVSTLITKGRTALTRATKMAAMKPRLKISRRMKKLPERKAADRKPDKAHVVALHHNRNRKVHGVTHHAASTRHQTLSLSSTTNDWSRATQLLNHYEAVHVSFTTSKTTPNTAPATSPPAENSSTHNTTKDKQCDWKSIDLPCLASPRRHKSEKKAESLREHQPNRRCSIYHLSLRMAMWMRRSLLFGKR